MMSNRPEILLSCVSSVYVRQMTFKAAGDIEQGHAHKFDHQTLVAKGSVKVTTDGKETVFNSPHIVFIRKEQVHELVAMEDDTVCYCIHALRDGDDVCDIIPPDSLPLGAGSQAAFQVADGLLYK